MRIVLGLGLVAGGLFIAMSLALRFIASPRRAVEEAILSSIIGLIMDSVGMVTVAIAMIVAGVMMVVYEVGGD